MQDQDPQFLRQSQHSCGIKNSYLKDVKGILGFVFQVARDLLKPPGRLLLGVGHKALS